MPRRYLTGGGNDLKNRYKSCSYFFKFFNLVKFYIKKLLSENKPSDRRTENNTASRRCLVNEKLTFGAYDKIGGVGARATRVVDFYFVRFVRFLGKVGVRVANVERGMSESTDHCAARGFCDVVRKFLLSWVCKKVRNLYQKLRFAAYDKIGGEGTRATCVVDFCFVRFVRFLGKVGTRATHFGHYITVLFQKFPLRVANRGAILIEFAVCMPILIILLFYIHDLVKIKRYYSQTEFVAQQMANILQNISQKRTDKRITANDLRYALTLAYQTIYPGKTMFWQGNGLYFVNVPHPLIYYVKGNSNGTATTVWGRVFWTNDSPAISPATIRSGTQTTSHDISQINMGTNLSPSQIYPTLKIEPGEVKIIIETLIFFRTTDPDINGKSGYTPREVFGCRLVSPKPWKNNNSNNTYTSDMSRGAFFNSVVIFTPKPGLFNETAPS